MNNINQFHAELPQDQYEEGSNTLKDVSKLLENGNSTEENPTPETDAARIEARDIDTDELVLLIPTEFAQKLECERDAMIKMNEVLCQFMNDEFKMTASDPRLVHLQALMEEAIPNPNNKP